MYKLSLEADTIEQLALFVSMHHNELSSILKEKGFGAALAEHVTNNTPIPPAAPVIPAAPVPANPIASGVTLNPPITDVTASGQVDSDGLPYDARIHSSSKKISATSGKWNRRKNVDDAYFNQIVNELRGTAASTSQPSGYSPPYVPTVAPVPAAPTYDPLNIPQTLPPAAPVAPVLPAFLQSMPQAATVPAAPVAPVIPAAPAAPAGQTINDLFNKIQQLFANHQADAAYILSLQNRLSQQFQVVVNSITDIGGRPDMIAYAFQLLAADGK